MGSKIGPRRSVSMFLGPLSMFRGLGYVACKSTLLAALPYWVSIILLA
jgi:hypothetical protein